MLDVAAQLRAATDHERRSWRRAILEAKWLKAVADAPLADLARVARVLDAADEGVGPPIVPGSPIEQQPAQGPPPPAQVEAEPRTPRESKQAYKDLLG